MYASSFCFVQAMYRKMVPRLAGAAHPFYVNIFQKHHYPEVQPVFKLPKNSIPIAIQECDLHQVEPPEIVQQRFGFSECFVTMYIYGLRVFAVYYILVETPHQMEKSKDLR